MFELVEFKGVPDSTSRGPEHKSLNGQLGIVLPCPNGPDIIFGDVRVYYASGQEQYVEVSQKSPDVAPKWWSQFSPSVKAQLGAKFRSSFDKPILERIFAGHKNGTVRDFSNWNPTTLNGFRRRLFPGRDSPVL